MVSVMKSSIPHTNTKESGEAFPDYGSLKKQRCQKCHNGLRQVFSFIQL